MLEILFFILNLFFVVEFEWKKNYESNLTKLQKNLNPGDEIMIYGEYKGRTGTVKINKLEEEGKERETGSPGRTLHRESFKLTKNFPVTQATAATKELYEEMKKYAGKLETDLDKYIASNSSNNSSDKFSIVSMPRVRNLLEMSDPYINDCMDEQVE